MIRIIILLIKEFTFYIWLLTRVSIVGERNPAQTAFEALQHQWWHMDTLHIQRIDIYWTLVFA